MNEEDITLRENLTRCRMDIAELKGMISMHFKDATHHTPPCAPAAAIQKSMQAAVGAAIVALLSALGCLLMEVIRHT